VGSGGTTVVIGGLILPESTLSSGWFQVLAAFVAINTMLYVTLAIAKIFPKLYVSDWVRRANRRAETRSIFPNGVGAPEGYEDHPSTRGSRLQPRDPVHFADLQHGTYIVATSDALPFRIVRINPVTGRSVERLAHDADEAWRIAHAVDSWPEPAIVVALPSIDAPEYWTVARLGGTTIRSLRDAAEEDMDRRRADDVDAMDALLRTWVYPRIGEVAVSEWTSEDSNGVMTTAAESLDREGRDRLYGAMRAIVNVGQRRGVIGFDRNDPLFDIEGSGSRRAKPIDLASLPTIDQCVAVEAAVADVIGPEWALGLRLTRESMIRWSELIALTPESFVIGNFGTSEFHRLEVREWIRESRGVFDVMRSEEGMARTTLFDEALIPELRAVLNGTSPRQRVFGRSGWTYPASKWWARKWNRSLKAAGFADRDWTIHTWRHVGAREWLYERHVDIADVSAALGHSDIGFTIDRYVDHGLDDKGATVGPTAAQTSEAEARRDW
jgi:integrase